MSSHQMWYKLRNELKWRELQVPSTFMTVGELRGLIIEHLGLPDGETVVLYPEEDLAYESAYPDVKQFPRGSRFRATRTTVEQLAKEEEQRAGQPQVEANEPGEGKKDDRGDNSESEESEFGPDPWDRDAADRWKEKERRTGKQQTTTARNTAVDLGEVVTPAPSKASPAHIPDSQELPALTYPHQSRELTQHEWEEKLKPRRKAEVDSAEAADMAPSGPGDPGVDEAQPTSTALVPAETRAMPASAPGKPSLLQQYPEIQYRCRSFLPQAPVELLYEVFSIGRAMNREAWDKWRAENAHRNPPQDPAPYKPEEGRTHLRRSQSRRHSRSPNRHDPRDRTRSYGRSPARSPAHVPRRQKYHAHRSYDADRWRDSDCGTPTGHGPDSRDRRAPSRNGDYNVPRPASRGAKSSSRSPRSPAPRRGRVADASGSSGGRRSRGARSARPTTPSPSPQPRAPPRRRNFDTQLPPQPPAIRPAGQGTARGSRLATFTPPPARTHAAPSDPARRRGQEVPAMSRASPRKAGDKRSRSRSQNRSVKAAGDRNGERRRCASQRADRSRSSSSSSSGSDSSRSRSGTSSSSSTSSSSQSRSRSRSPRAQPRRRPEANERGGQRGGSRASGVRGHEGKSRDAGERAGPQDQRGRGRRSPAKAGRDRDESPDTVKRNKKRMKGSQKKVIHVSAPKASPKSSKDRSALFAKAVQGLRR
eukprot:jgi/Ulvmu1/10829/UM007_0003.1